MKIMSLFRHRPRISEVEPHLTPTEDKVLRKVADGYSNKEIGYCLCVSEQTIKNHMSNILVKLCARNRAHAAVIWKTSGLAVKDCRRRRR